MTTLRPATIVIKRNISYDVFISYNWMSYLEMSHDLCDSIQALSGGGV